MLIESAGVAVGTAKAGAVHATGYDMVVARIGDTDLFFSWASHRYLCELKNSLCKQEGQASIKIKSALKERCLTVIPAL